MSTNNMFAWRNKTNISTFLLGKKKCLIWSYLHCSFYFLFFFQNKFKAGTYPGSPSSWLFVVMIVLALKLANVDPSLGMIDLIQNHVPG